MLEITKFELYYYCMV